MSGDDPIRERLDAMGSYRGGDDLEGRVDALVDALRVVLDLCDEWYDNDGPGVDSLIRIARRAIADTLGVNQ